MRRHLVCHKALGEVRKRGQWDCKVFDIPQIRGKKEVGWLWPFSYISQSCPSTQIQYFCPQEQLMPSALLPSQVS